MVLFASVMGRMLVDNGIVVVENVYRLMDEGYSKLSAKQGWGNCWPIIASTGTTLAAFLLLIMFEPLGSL